MTDKKFGHDNFFFANVVSRADTEQSGRLQLRVYGVHDDTTTVPDKDLPWARTLSPTNSASKGRRRNIAYGRTGRLYGLWNMAR